MPLRLARSLGTVVLERTVLELQGEPCLSFDEVEPQRKGMAVTRSAGTPMTDFHTVFQALTAHATRAAEKLRQHGLVAGTLTVFFHTNRHRMDRPQYAGSRTTRMTPMSSDTFHLVEAARRCAQAAWPKDHTRAFGFTKAGIMLDDLLRLEDRPLTLFDAEKPKSQALMTALDQVNDMVCLRLSLSSGERGPVYWPHKSLAVEENDHVILCRARCIRQIRFDLCC